MSPTWMFRTKEAEAARIAAQRHTRQQAGNCIRCGLKQDANSRQLCTTHLHQQRAAAQRKLDAQARKGKTG